MSPATLVARTVGLDLGTANDWTALTVLDHLRADREDGSAATSYRLSYVRRMRHMAWPAIVDALAAIAAYEALRGAEWVVDAGGVGAPVVDLLRQRVANVLAVTITGAESANQVGPRAWTVPKIDLMSGLQVAIQQGVLTSAPGLKEANALRLELLDFQYKITEHGQMTSSAAGSGHDDLVLSLALGVWAATASHRNGFEAWMAYLGDAAKPAHEPRAAAPRPQGEAARQAARQAAYLAGKWGPRWG